MTISFDEVRFPVTISRGASGGPERRTEIVALASGREERNSRWAHSRRRYNAGFGVRTLDEIHEVVRFFEERRGRLHGFRWKDHADFKSGAPNAELSATDQTIGEGTGGLAGFQLVKRYGSGLRDYVRTIAKPVAGTVKIAVDGVVKTEGTDFAVDPTTGMVTFLDGHLPGTGAAVSAGFEFDVPVRFDTDYLSINLASFKAGDIPDIAIIEVRP
jgi:uncharacterized protein (TIGR02217 family)